MVYDPVIDKSGLRASRHSIPAQGVASLTWCGDRLVDWVGGGLAYHLDGRREDPRSAWFFPFDAACATPDGRYAVVYQRHGTKALLLRDGNLLRELNRSFYHAHVYDYPVHIWRAPDGRTLLAHCPEDYRRIEIDDADTGTRLTAGERTPKDFFHSRLMVNETGTRLLSAGWVWHPWDAVSFYDIAEALRDPAHLDSLVNSAPHSRNVSLAEESSACWQTSERVLLGGSAEEEDPNDDPEITEPRLHTRGIAVYDVVAKTYVRSAILTEPPGTMMPIGESHAVCFYKWPRLVSLADGQVVMGWEDLACGDQVSSISRRDRFPALAIDVEHRRFAVADADQITVVQIDATSV